MSGDDRGSATGVADTGRRLDVSDWLTKGEAAAALGVTPKTIERWTQAGKLEQRFRKQPGSPDVAVFCPEDVARLTQAQRSAVAAPFVLPAAVDASKARVNGTAVQPAGAPSADDLARALFAAAMRAALSQTPAVSQTSQTTFVTIPEAAALTGLTQAYLRRAIQAEQLPAVRDRGWRIRRKDLEQL